MPWRQFVAAGVYWTIYAVTLRRIDWGQSIYTEFPYIWPLRHPRFWNPRYHSMCDLFCRFFRASCCVVPLVVGGLSPIAKGQETQSDFFEARIRPILVDHCEICHSLSTQKSSGGLVLDSADGWKLGGDSGPAIVPGNPEESLLIRAVRAQGHSPMPPADSGLSLTESQIRDLEAWVMQGAYDPRKSAERIGGMRAEDVRSWWSFQPLGSHEPPEVVHDQWVWNPIDRFVVAGLEAQGLGPVSTASKREWIRRVTLDLTGLVPTPDQIREYLADESPQADARLVDRLLESHEHAERYGRHWLDVARYSDTAGDGADYPVREAYRYRDWVIRSIYANKPWDQFLREQIAGDLFARDLAGSSDAADGPARLEAYADLVTATGFLAIGKRYGYAPNADFQHLDFADAIDSIGRSFLGLSIGCARCHDHKYDPITVQDYYALYGIMQSTLWAFPGGEEQKRPANFPALAPPEQVARLEQHRTDRLRSIDQEMERARAERMELDPSYHAGGIDLDLEAQEVGKPPTKAWLSAGPNAVLSESQSPYAHVFGQGTRGVRVGAGTPFEGVRYVLDRKLTLTDRPLYFALDFRVPESTQGSCRLYLGRGVIESIALECSISKDAFAIKSAGEWKVVSALEVGQWYHLQLKLDPSDMTWSGGLYGDRFEATIPKTPVSATWDRHADTFICDGFGHIGDGVLARDLDNLGIHTEPFAAFGSPALERPSRSPASQELFASLDKQDKELQTQRAAIAAEVLYGVAYGVSESKPTDARIQLRGEPSKTSDEVPRRFLSVLGGQLVPRDHAESGRRELAYWLSDPKNPLASRVFVNRVWHWHFGQGLVPTTSDFGVRGQAPSHPELLDYLSLRFIESGWDVRQLHRWIVLSRTYHLTSQVDAPEDIDRVSKGGQLDPGNRWLWRSVKRPMDAETLRDSILSVSGLLDRGVPKEHPFPSVDTWAFTIHNPFHAVYESAHRSVYLMQQRNRKHPYLGLFDGADPNLSVDQRQATTTPTQTLYLMNSPLVHQASESLSKRCLGTTSDVTARLQLVYETTLGRPPSPEEQTECLEFLEAYAQREPSDGELKAWGALCRVLMTSNSFLYID